jgi:hypothetical protein
MTLFQIAIMCVCERDKYNNIFFPEQNYKSSISEVGWVLVKGGKRRVLVERKRVVDENRWFGDRRLV